ncbi:MAG TPA: SURF1 family cytochrome oxidase biogenesis protein [Caulobacteraceae bacterium]|nr:SURF1 family cytochrome oxidase biogenesis protein [Caulobacteraceae bacterium]
MATSEITRPRFAVIPAVATAVGIAILIGLGVWQVQRLHWKENLLARIAALQSAPPEPLDVVLRRAADGLDVDYERVQATCPDIETAPYVRLYSVKDGYAGNRIIAACPLAGGAYGAILVDRGFLAQGLTPTPGQTISAPVIGILRRGDTRNFATPRNDPAGNLWYGRDIAAMARALGVARPAPTYLMLEQPAPPPGGPVIAPLPTDIPNNHLQYAITWFGLAVALAGVYLASLWRKRPR